MAIVDEYAPKLIDDKDVIATMITDLCVANEIEISFANRGRIMKIVMPGLKTRNCDMKVVQEVLKTMLS
jgi:uncharacterized protein YqeY